MHRSILTLSATLLLGTACGSDGDKSGDDAMSMLDARTLVGDVASSDILLGAIVEDDDITVYACGGLDTFATHSRWFVGTIGTADDPDAFSLTEDGLTLHGRRTANGLSGTLVDRDGSERMFSIGPVDEDGLSGLYATDIDGCRTGVVLVTTPDGVDGQGTYCNDAGEFIQVIILQPVALTSGGVPVQVDKTDGPLTFSVAPL